MKAGDKIFFASDFHLGLDAGMNPLKREKHVVRWLRSIADEAKAIYLVGDVFDFWWEYKSVVPRGFTRFLGTVSELSDRGIEIHFFTGNHDMWVRDYLQKECGMKVHTRPLKAEILGKIFYIAHGEGLGSREPGYRFLLWIFRNRFLRVLYSALHPRTGLAIAHGWSKHSRLAKNYMEEAEDLESEALVIHARNILKTDRIDFFIFGHRHIKLDYRVENSRIFILGNWFNAPCFLEWNGEKAELRDFIYR
jgi:UDP-2,3-diacylglucosamine hydrolase